MKMVQRTAFAHIAINALLLNLSPTYRGAGISHYERLLLEALATVNREMQITAIVGDGRWQPPPRMRVYRPAWPTTHPALRIAWEQVAQVRALRRMRASLFHGLAFAGPQWGAHIPQVITVHDLTFVRFPQTLPTWKARYLRWITRRSVQRAARVIAVSESTRQDVLQWLGLPPERVVTVHNGVEARFRPLPQDRVAAWRREHGLPERFVLYLGTLQPRKNLELLVRAFARWREQAPPAARDVKLVLAGARGWYYDYLFALVERLGLREHVLFPGYVPADALPYWYNAATLFAYPSVYEGFGLPVLEAMACGTPVLAARASSLPEVVGDAGLLLPPKDVAAWADALGQLLDDPDRRHHLSQTAQERARAFSWERTARQTLAVYQEVLEEAHA